MSPSTARMTMKTTAILMIGSGSLNGIAAQFNFPSMSTSRVAQRRRSPGGTRLSGTRDRLVDDVLKQLRIHRMVGCGRNGRARLCQRGIAGIVERGPGDS